MPAPQKAVLVPDNILEIFKTQDLTKLPDITKTALKQWAAIVEPLPDIVMGEEVPPGIVTPEMIEEGYDLE